MKLHSSGLLKRTLCLASVFTLLFVSTFGTTVSAAKLKTYKKTTTSSGAIKAKGYDYKKAVPQNATQKNSYFDDAVFLGDSRTVGLYIYSSLKNTKARPYCDIGLNVSTVKSKKFVSYRGRKVKALYALKKNKKSVKKIYLMFGMNELSWSKTGFINSYKSLINEIRKITPNAVIYVQSILPVTKSLYASDKVHTRARIKSFNKTLREMCNTKKVFYIDAFKAMSNSKGYLPEAASTDGIHLNVSYCEKWLGYLKKRTIIIKK